MLFPAVTVLADRPRIWRFSATAYIVCRRWQYRHLWQTRTFLTSAQPVHLLAEIRVNTNIYQRLLLVKRYKSCRCAPARDSMPVSRLLKALTGAGS